MYRIVNGLIAIPASLYLTPNTQNTRGHGCKFRVPPACVDAYTTVSSLLLFGFGTSCRLTSLCPLPSRHSSLDWQAFRRLRRQFRDIHPVIFCTLQHVFICLRNLDLSVAAGTSCTSAMHDIITQLWGMCIGETKKKMWHIWRNNNTWSWRHIATASYRALRRRKNYLPLVRLLQTCAKQNHQSTMYSEWLAYAL